MPRITKVYTRSGDAGKTRLGGGQARPKHDLRVGAYGTVDELNALLGDALVAGLEEDTAAEVRRIQHRLFDLGADLCLLEEDKKDRADSPRIEREDVTGLERLMDRLSEELGPLEEFLLPGGAPGAARLHVARAVCRRAERLVTALAEREPVGPNVLPYLNRLSDALFVLARHENHRKGVAEPLWKPR